MIDAATKLMTVAGFLEWDDGTGTRHELVSGRVVAMAPVSPNDSMIAARITGLLENALKRPRYAGIEAGVVRPDRSDSFCQAEIVVSGSPWQKGMATLPEPVVIVEVLSPSTIEHDRGRKAYDYSRIDSVQEIVLVSSEQRHVVIWRRGTKWEFENLIGDAALELQSVGVMVPFAAIYDNIGV